MELRQIVEEAIGFHRKTEWFGMAMAAPIGPYSFSKPGKKEIESDPGVDSMSMKEDSDLPE